SRAPAARACSSGRARHPVLPAAPARRPPGRTPLCDRNHARTAPAALRAPDGYARAVGQPGPGIQSRGGGARVRGRAHRSLGRGGRAVGRWPSLHTHLSGAGGLGRARAARGQPRHRIQAHVRPATGHLPPPTRPPPLPDPAAAVAADAGRRRNLESFRMAWPLLRVLGVCYRWFGMRAVAAWVVLAVGGCLYTDDINQRPIVRGIAYDPAPTRSDRPFDVTIDPLDLDGDSIQVSWSLTDPQGMATPGREARVHVSPHSQPGNWNLDGEAVDEPGASTPFHAVILVPNLAPHIDRITVNPPPGSGNYALL